MKTALYSTIYLDGNDDLGSSRFDRTLKWINYYKSIREELGFDTIVMTDNGSSRHLLYKLEEHVGGLGIRYPQFSRAPLNAVNVFTHPNHLQKYSSGFPPETENDKRREYDYPYCWRGLWFVRNLFQSYGFDKVIIADTDAFILTKKLANHIRDAEHGWAALWCPKWDFPECTIQVIDKLGSEKFLRFTDSDWKAHVGCCMEVALPYNVKTQFKGDRYGETRTPPDSTMDYYCQCPVDIEMKFEGAK